MFLSTDVTILISYFVIVGVLLFVDRKNLEFNSGLIIRRWRHGREAMDKWIFSHRDFLEALGTVGVALGLIASVVGFVGMVWAITQIQAGVQGAALVLPTVDNIQYPTSGVLEVPFIFWLISIFVVLTVHEPMHAIFSRLANVPVRSWGIMTFFVVPLGAFVDPDEKKIARLKLLRKLKIFAGGSLGNFMAAGVILVLGFILSSTLIGQFVVPGTPADQAGLEGKISSVNGVEIVGMADISRALNDVPPGSEIAVVTDRGTYAVTTAVHPDGAEGSYLGISLIRPGFYEFGDVILFFSQLFFWLFVFNFGIGVANMLPIRPLDGGWMYYSIFQKVFKDDKKARTMINITSVVTGFIIFLAIFGRDILGLLIG